MIWKVSGWSEKCTDDTKSVWLMWKMSWLFGWSEKCTDDLKSAPMIWKVFGWFTKDPDGLQSVWMIQKLSQWPGKCPDHVKWRCGVVGSGLVWLLVLALYGSWLWLCGSWFWLWPHLVVGCGHMLLLVVTTDRCIVGLLDVASFGCWLWPRVLWATPAPNWQLSTGVLASWPWSPRCNLTKKSMKFFLGQGLVRISW